jgi:manganese/zinc/iron transport system permease protein
MFSEYFLSPVYRGPLIGSILMCMVTALVGGFVFLKKQSLISETLSHSSFPGVVLGALVSSVFLPVNSEYLAVFILIGAFIFSLISLYLLRYFERRTLVKNDTALCFILAWFFAIGLLLVSQMQFTAPLFYKKSLTFLYGQVATMTDKHIVIYGALLLITLLCMILFYHPIKAYLFDPLFFQGLGLPIKLVESVLFGLLLFAIIIGISSVGVVLLSGMLIAPCVAARQWTSRYHTLFILSALIGAVSAFLGVVFSIQLSLKYSLSFPTGPSIILVATSIALVSLIIAPKKGIVFRFVRLLLFRLRCIEENILKGMWQYNLKEKKALKKAHNLSFFTYYFLLWHMGEAGWVTRKKNRLLLTKDGENKAKKIVRLHRLWEVYLADHLGIGHDKVHQSAEQIEHLITEDLEKKLTEFLDDPKEDPHQKPIPQKEV